MIEKINNIIKLMEELENKFPEDLIVLDINRWKRRLIQYKRNKEIQKEMRLIDETEID